MVTKKKGMLKNPNIFLILAHLSGALTKQQISGAAQILCKMLTSTSQPSQALKPKSHPITFIATGLLACIVLLGLVVLITWLIVKPKRLVYTIEDGSIQNFNLTNDQLSANFDFVIRSYNPNKRVSIYYDSIQATVNYHDQTLAFSGVDPFYQRHRNVTRFDLKFTAHSTALSSSVSKDLQLEKRSGNIQFDVWLKARIRFKVGVCDIYTMFHVIVIFIHLFIVTLNPYGLTLIR